MQKDFRVKQKKIIFFTLVFSLALFLTPSAAFGQEQIKFLQNVGKQAGYQQATTRSVATIVGNIIYGTLGLLGVIFLVLTVYAGFLRLTAGGEESRVEKANAYIKNGVIGLAIVLAAFGITAFVVRVLIGATITPPGGGQPQTVPENYQNLPNPNNP